MVTLRNFKKSEVIQEPLPCKRPVPLQSPETPKPQKCILKSEKYHFRPPGKRPRKSIKMSKKSIFGHFNSPKMDFLDILIDFRGLFSGGSKMVFFGTLKCTFGVSGLCRGTGRLQPLPLKPKIPLSVTTRFRKPLSGRKIWKNKEKSIFPVNPYPLN